MIYSSILAVAALASATPIKKRSVPSGVPSYVAEYAPIVYLYSGETYFPSDLGTQLTFTTPEVNFTSIPGANSSYTLNNVNSLNKFGNGGNDVYLTTTTPEYDYPSQFGGVKPNSNGQTENAYSSTIIVNDLGSGNVDVFYWYFYAFNYGGTYVDQTIDDHVGDWEYNAVRFANGVPTQVWYSQHSYGSVYTYDAVSKYNGGVRPISYSANGSHANYPTPGSHEISLTSDNIHIPGIDDHTDAGYLWDPTLEAYWYSYDNTTAQFTSYDSSQPINWLYFEGGWGDQQLPTDNSHQDCIFDITSICKWDNGPPGPIGHGLSRSTICPDAGNCKVQNSTSS